MVCRRSGSLNSTCALPPYAHLIVVADRSVRKGNQEQIAELLILARDGRYHPDLVDALRGAPTRPENVPLANAGACREEPSCRAWQLASMRFAWSSRSTVPARSPAIN